jgi:hypothetical protein
MIITRQQAIAQNAARYFTGNACIKGHVSERYTANKTCCECANALSKKTKTKNPEKYAKLLQTWAGKNPEKLAKYQLKYNRKKSAQRNLFTANYRSAKDKRKPAWLNAGQLFEIQSIYEYCSALRFAGLDYHLDHIVPLRGKIVSGLHVPWNLQVIPGRENTRKGNSFNG